MKPVLKVAIVIGGYLLSFLVAAAAVALNEGRLKASNVQGSDGMAAFGDLVLFVVVFGALALLPTGAALFFLFSRKPTPKPPR